MDCYGLNINHKDKYETENCVHVYYDCQFGCDANNDELNELQKGKGFDFMAIAQKAIDDRARVPVIHSEAVRRRREVNNLREG